MILTAMPDQSCPRSTFAALPLSCSVPRRRRPLVVGPTRSKTAQPRPVIADSIVFVRYLVNRRHARRFCLCAVDRRIHYQTWSVRTPGTRSCLPRPSRVNCILPRLGRVSVPSKLSIHILLNPLPSKHTCMLPTQRHACLYTHKPVPSSMHYAMQKQLLVYTSNSL